MPRSECGVRGDEVTRSLPYTNLTRYSKPDPPLGKTGILEFSPEKWSFSLMNQALTRFQFGRKNWNKFQFGLESAGTARAKRYFIFCVAHLVVARFQDSNAIPASWNWAGTLESLCGWDVV